MPPLDPERLLTASELAGWLGVTPGTILAWRRAGRIPARELSRKVIRFNLAEVSAALARRPASRREGGER